MTQPATSRRGAPARSRLPDDSNKADEDTIAGCGARAAADLGRAARMDTLNGRARLEASAASWRARAAILQQDEDSFETNRALARAEWKAGEDATCHERPEEEAEACGPAPA